jgi:hypothetical protein
MSLSSKKAGKAARKREAEEIFKKLGIKYTEHNNGFHWIVENHWDFWPTSHKAMNRNTGQKLFGLDNFMAARNAFLNPVQPIPKHDRPTPPEFETKSDASALYALICKVIQSDEFKEMFLASFTQSDDTPFDTMI